MTVEPFPNITHVKGIPLAAQHGAPGQAQGKVLPDQVGPEAKQPGMPVILHAAFCPGIPIQTGRERRKLGLPQKGQETLALGLQFVADLQHGTGTGIIAEH